MEIEVFSILNHHKCISYLFPLHLNTYVIGLDINICGNRLYAPESDVYRPINIRF